MERFYTIDSNKELFFLRVYWWKKTEKLWAKTQTLGLNVVFTPKVLNGDKLGQHSHFMCLHFTLHGFIRHAELMRVNCNHLALCYQNTAWCFPSAFDEGLVLNIYIAYTVYNIPLIRKWLSARSVLCHSGEVVSEEKHSIVDGTSPSCKQQLCRELNQAIDLKN